MNENDFHSQVVSVASERALDAALSHKGDEIMNFKKKGRYKYNFIIDYEEDGKEIRMGVLFRRNKSQRGKAII